jgi:hypothetical protein
MVRLPLLLLVGCILTNERHPNTNTEEAVERPYRRAAGVRWLTKTKAGKNTLRSTTPGRRRAGLRRPGISGSPKLEAPCQGRAGLGGLVIGFTENRPGGVELEYSAEPRLTF